MNLTRWGLRLPGRQRRPGSRAAAAAAPAVTDPSPVPAARGRSAAPVVPVDGPSDSTFDAVADPATAPTTDGASADTPPGGARDATGRPPAAPTNGTVLPAANGSASVTLPASGLDTGTVHELLGRVPAPVAVVQGPDHRVTYVNEAYAEVFGARATGAPAREALTELVDLGLLPLMDQVRNSGTPRTLKTRRVPGPGRDGFYTFTCTPVEMAPAPLAAAPVGEIPAGPGDTRAPEAPAVPPVGARAAARAGTRLSARGRSGRGRTGVTRGHPRSAGVLVFAADVTDQVVSAERLRESESRQRAAAVTLQRSLLPRELEQPDDLRVAATYQPGGTDAAVGGDWYDVITLGAGRTALVIGDVMGRGVRAAAVMGQLRTAVRAYALLDLPPHEVLQFLDELASEIDPQQIATCLYAVYDPHEDTIVYASAGHIPIVIRSPDGTVERAEEPTGPPLGTGGWLHTSGTLGFPPGSAAVLCTDGLVERRDADIEDGLNTLQDAFAGAVDSPRVVCDRMLRAMGITEHHDDDVAVLVMIRPERSPAESGLARGAVLDLHGGTEAASRARAFADGVLASWRFSDELREAGVLAASELVANSLVHGRAPMRLRLRRTDRRLIVEVTDGDEHLPRLRRAREADEHGRGISVIASLAADWGARRLPEGGKSVWAEFVIKQASDA
ncbi:SpoIIE family protein phosphatase [Streptomyces sp. ST2-7A]|uniref:ATP-binding SpoIIE family protein phosphatase n=1 Tax=Streptomyces sp. ST2-7A TaxID=2907214 RepID=UPI001F4140D4|nr:SpoIIE family protein phosphatase [Streptomyces sp. ST2-7A]MCE7083545.1 SpoIIE family protein phosphatase [Streptomyces sp. ST2-7A]